MGRGRPKGSPGSSKIPPAFPHSRAIRALRKARGWTIQAAADVAGVDYQILSVLETGGPKRDKTWSIRRILTVLGNLGFRVSIAHEELGIEVEMVGSEYPKRGGAIGPRGSAKAKKAGRKMREIQARKRRVKCSNCGGKGHNREMCPSDEDYYDEP
jgi:transcriptional regulator with XRE-family HTH domain